MAINFKKLAEEKAAERGGCELFEGRKVLKNDMVIAMFPDGVTITAAEVYEGNDERNLPYKMAAYLIAEDPTLACKGGKALIRIFEEWAAAYNGDYALMNRDLAASGGVKVRLEKVLTENNIVTTNVEVL